MTTHRVVLKIKDTSYEKDGEFFAGDLAEERETVWHVNPAECNHTETMCFNCIRDWTEGYWATLYFGPSHPEQPFVDLNQMVELQGAFVSAAQAVHVTVKTAVETFERLAKDTFNRISQSLKPTGAEGTQEDGNT